MSVPLWELAKRVSCNHRLTDRSYGERQEQRQREHKIPGLQRLFCIIVHSQIQP